MTAKRRIGLPGARRRNGRASAKPAERDEAEHIRWLSSEPGRGLFRQAGHSLRGLLPDGETTRLDGDGFDPATLPGIDTTGPPHNGWVRVDGHRLYLSWGEDGFRLLHPFPSPTPSLHVNDADVLEKALGVAAPIVIFGPPRAGKSLLTAVLTTRKAERGWRVLYVTGLPSHDLGDGDRIIHQVRPPGGELRSVREAFDRWRPEAVVIDLDPCEALANFIRDCRMAGTRIALTLRSSESQAARDRIRAMTGNVAGWHFFSPWPVAPGPRLDVSLEAA